VTTLQRGGGVRSMGASLLDQVLAETLDPAYQQAADARATRERDALARGVEPPERSRRRRLSGHVLVGLVLALAGLLVAVTYNQASAGAKGRAQVREALLGDIDAGSRATDDLTAQLGTLRSTVDRTRDSALRATSEGQLALSQLASAEQGAGAVPVTGPGLRVTLADAESGADADPVGGRTAAQSGGLVRDSDLQLVVNALWAAGAEAISVDGQRLGPTTTIRTAGEAILVDFRPVANPYQITAVGDSSRLSSRFLANPEVQGLAVVAQSYDLRFEFAKEAHLSLTAATAADLHSAQPVTPAGNAAANGSGGGAAGSGTAAAPATRGG
jgi:uncharacterized protein YlxW (UPF0749 family)